MNEQIPAMQIDVMKLVKACLKRWYLILVVAIIGAAAGFSYAYYFIEDTYSTNITLYVNGFASSYQYGTSGDMSASQQLINTYATIIKSNTVMLRVSKQLDYKYDYKYLQSCISSISQVGNTAMVKVYVTATSPEAAREIADAVAEAAPREISNIIASSSAWTLDNAETPVRSGPSYKKYTAVGGAFGAMLVAGIICIKCLLDVTIRTVEDLARICDIPVIGTIPDLSKLGKSNSKVYKKSEYETYTQ